MTFLQIWTHKLFAFSDPKTYVLLKNSLIYALGSAIVGVSIATVLAFITTRTDAPLRNQFRFIPILPIILPGMVDNLAWIYLFSPNSGLVNVWYRNIFNATEPLFSIYTMYGMIWVMGISLVPLAYLVISAAFYTMDPSLEETARIAGSSLFTIFRKITIPLMLPSILSVFLFYRFSILKIYHWGYRICSTQMRNIECFYFPGGSLQLQIILKLFQWIRNIFSPFFLFQYPFTQ